jgi:hypothetical protein
MCCILVVTAALAGCDQWTYGYLQNASDDTITLRLRQTWHQSVRDNRGQSHDTILIKWTDTRLEPGSSFRLWRQMGTELGRSSYDSIEVTGRGFALQLSGETLLLLPVEERAHSYYYQIGWSREDE